MLRTLKWLLQIPNSLSSWKDEEHKHNPDNTRLEPWGQELQRKSVTQTHTRPRMSVLGSKPQHPGGHNKLSWCHKYGWACAHPCVSTCFPYGSLNMLICPFFLLLQPHMPRTSCWQTATSLLTSTPFSVSHRQTQANPQPSPLQACSPAWAQSPQSSDPTPSSATSPSPGPPSCPVHS